MGTKNIDHLHLDPATRIFLWLDSSHPDPLQLPDITLVQLINLLCYSFNYEIDYNTELTDTIQLIRSTLEPLTDIIHIDITEGSLKLINPAYIKYITV